MSVSALQDLQILEWLLGQRVVHRLTDTQRDKNTQAPAGRDVRLVETSDLPDLQLADLQLADRLLSGGALQPSLALSLPLFVPFL